VIDVVRGQWKIETFAMELKALAQRFPGAPMRFYGNTTEKGSAHLLAMLGVPIHHRLTITDKYARALPVSVAWNRGDVLIPAVTRNNAGWLSDFTRVVTNFTGAKGEENDDVDAMSAAFDQLPERRPATILKPGSKEWLLAEETAMREERKREVEESIERRYEEEHPWE
jgi:predicted phage terminase large subunit-like protein